MRAFEERFIIEDKTYENTTGVEQVFYDAAGTPVHILPGETKSFKIRRRAFPGEKISETAVEVEPGGDRPVEKEKDVTNKSNPGDQGKKESGEPKKRATGGTARRYHRRGA